MTHALGRTLLIANPAAQNGNGKQAARYAEEKLRGSIPESDFVLKLTEAPRHGFELAATSASFDTVVALGGDGVIHEIANGLMSLPEAQRPQFGVLPVGSGNDYAKTLGVSFTLEESVEQLTKSQSRLFDVGCCNGEYFVETLSFGLDAAIALDTVKRRVETGKRGARLFFESGIDMLLHNLHTYDYVMRLDGVGSADTAAIAAAEVDVEEAAEHRGQMMLFAVQVGKTYGGGFTICPKASTDDGLFDLCIAHPPMGVPKAVMIFILAKDAHHTKFKQLEFLTTSALNLRFEGKIPPVQIDGEAFAGESFDIACIPHALRVLVPS
ncbi:MAG: diacylglycerol kinase family lipid kinase [Eggerthellaceae bacterium]|jgi:YegS/Rv2252/BmrU family lipid kinase|nr:diacylglycerol kinase family lipid kinase [Eggerthellaceae bacterium]MDR2721513.1 diacylglycerol kinase family lipid kinase [Coriobacteriaceae bacterium]